MLCDPLGLNNSTLKLVGVCLEICPRNAGNVVLKRQRFCSLLADTIVHPAAIIHAVRADAVQVENGLRPPGRKAIHKFIAPQVAKRPSLVIGIKIPTPYGKWRVALPVVHYPCV